MLQVYSWLSFLSEIEYSARLLQRVGLRLYTYLRFTIASVPKREETNNTVHGRIRFASLTKQLPEKKRIHWRNFYNRVPVSWHTKLRNSGFQNKIEGANRCGPPKTSSGS